MLTLGTHLFNMMRYFAGDVAWMTAHMTTDGRAITLDDAHEATEPSGLVAGDCINSYFAFKSGVSCFFDSRRDQTTGSSGRYGMDVVGSEGMISLRGGTASDVVIYPHSPWTPGDTSQKWEKLDLGDTPLQAGNHLAIVDLIDCIENDGEPISSVRAAVAALEMILGTYESQITGKRVAFPIENRSHPLERFCKQV